MPLPPFQRLVDDHGEDVFRFLVAVAGAQDADDCWQETYLAALRAYPDVRSGSNLRAWLFTIAHNKAMDTHRARAAARRAGRRCPRAGARSAGRRRRSPSCGPRWTDCRASSGRRCCAATSADLPYADIAVAMGTSPDAARRNVFEGLRKLREVWDER